MTTCQRCCTNGTAVGTCAACWAEIDDASRRELDAVRSIVGWLALDLPSALALAASIEAEREEGYT